MKKIILLFLLFISITYANVNVDETTLELLNMLKLISKSLGVLAVILLALLVYFITDNIRFKRKTLKELEKAKQELENSTIKDTLTGLSNKKYFDDIFNVEQSISTREKSYLNLFILDINNYNNFKMESKEELNEVLKIISNFLKHHFKRATDSIFKLEDGQFAGIILSKNKDEVKNYLEKLLENIGNSNQNISISIGLKTNHIEEKLNKETIYKMALHALQNAKNIGTNKIIEFDETLEH
jgi:diguanylate cyclase (GGDEF)-like protein